MTQSQSVWSRIRNARASLDNAERSFRSNQEVRGELDLMLAEAELENLRQKRAPVFSWTRHTLALCLAVMILAAGGLGWWWASAYGGNTTNAAGRQALPAVAETAGPAVRNPVPAKDEPRSVTVVSASAAEQRPALTQETARNPADASGSLAQERENRNVTLSSSQMRQLIRSGKQELGNIK